MVAPAAVPGLQRVDVLWRAIAKGAVVHAVDPTIGYVVLSWGLPAAATGGRALHLVTGPDQPVSAVLDLSHHDIVGQLRTLFDGDQQPRH